MSGFDSSQITQLLWADEKTGRAETPEALLRKSPTPFDTRDRRHKLLNHETDAQKTAAESPEKFRQRDPASLSFESIDRRSF